MRLLTAQHNGAPHVGVLHDYVVYFPDPGPASMLELIDAGPSAWRAFATSTARGPAVPVDAVDWLAPIPRPRKNVMCLGWNYADHAQESAAVREQRIEPPQHPIVFTKNITSVTGPHSDVPLHAGVTEQLDWEVELGVIIGVGGRDIAPADAAAHIFGYTVINDISARDLQFRHKQYFLGKSLDGACPMGPVIVTADEFPDPPPLDLRSWVNGTLKQSSNTRHMIFSIGEIIHALSRGMTLEPGDIIATGTPSGVGFARRPPEFLRAGDIVECEVQGIGRLKNRVVG